ncbi:hypothetical protein C8Q74DRAFT_1366285 [Fomes fomentarius]|nr:hypothetical protein C8Q74DRAFT_1366285 [Fomes fomentarius]
MTIGRTPPISHRSNVFISKNTKVYVGALASSAEGSSGYVDPPAMLINIALAARSQQRPHQPQAKNAICNSPNPGVSTTTTKPATVTTTTSKPVVTTATQFTGHLWTAKWWTYASTPGGSAGDCTDDGAYTSFAAAAPTGYAMTSTSAKIA